MTAGMVTQEKAEGLKAVNEMERVMGIEPTLSGWEPGVLPLNYTRVEDSF